MHITLTDIIIRISAAAVVGGIIGIERQIKGKAAGLRTTMLICIGAALFMLISQMTSDSSASTGLSGDAGRIAAQVVSGIGFLGAGAILHSRAGVSGLTTAATIFVVAAIGLAIGGGYWLPAIVSAVVVLCTLFLLGKLEYLIYLRRQIYHYSLTTTDAQALIHEIGSILSEFNLKMEQMELNKKDNVFHLSFSITASAKISQQVLRRLLATGSVSEITAPGGLLMEEDITM